MLSLADIIEALTGTRPNRTLPVITEAVVDSRQVIPGALFVAVPGERVDGHAYVDEAFQRGASCALVQHHPETVYPVIDLRGGSAVPSEMQLLSPLCVLVVDTLEALQRIAAFWRRKLKVKVIGITGSVGKSTTKEVTADVLSQRYSTLRNPGNLNNEIGLPLTLLSLSDGHQRAVLEMGFYVPGEIKFLCDLALPHIGVVTNVGTVHAERAGDQDAIARGKAELVQSLPVDGVAILNHDDERVRRMASVTQAQVFFYGLDSRADLWADQVEGLGLEGIRLRLHYQGETLHFRVPMIGRHSVHTVLRAAAVGLVDGSSWQEIYNGLRSSSTQLRLMAIRTSKGALILDDTYNASPASTLAALSLLEELEGRKVAVLGDMLELGPYEQRGHEMVGIRAAEVAQLLIAVGTRARMIARMAIDAGMPETQVTMLDDPMQVVDVLNHILDSDDVVLIKGSNSLRMDRIVAALEGGE